MITELELIELKEYMRVDGTDDDTVIRSLATAAEQYLQNAGVPVQSDNSLYTLARNALVLQSYDNRGGEQTISPALQSMIKQLQYTEA